MIIKKECTVLNLKLSFNLALKQCLKLRMQGVKVHPAPGMHHLVAGCTHFGTCATVECILFQSISIHYNRPEHKENSSSAQF